MTSAAPSVRERTLRTSDGISHTLTGKPAGSFLTKGQWDGAQGDLRQTSLTTLKGSTLGDRDIHQKALLGGADGLLTQMQAQD